VSPVSATHSARSLSSGSLADVSSASRSTSSGSGPRRSISRSRSSNQQNAERASTEAITLDELQRLSVIPLLRMILLIVLLILILLYYWYWYLYCVEKIWYWYFIIIAGTVSLRLECSRLHELPQSSACRHAEFSPWLSSRRSASMVWIQVWCGWPGWCFQFLGAHELTYVGLCMCLVCRSSLLLARRNWGILSGWATAGLESYFSIHNMIRVRYLKITSDSDVVKGSDRVFRGSCKGPCCRTIEEDRLNVKRVQSSIVHLRLLGCGEYVKQNGIAQLQRCRTSQNGPTFPVKFTLVEMGMLEHHILYLAG